VTRAVTCLAVLLLSTVSVAQPAARQAARVASRDVIVALAAHPADATQSILVGPSAQAYEPSPSDGRWLRHREGGVAADVSGAALVGGELLVSGVATPLYRRRAGAWFTTRFGEDGATLLGHGPTPAVLVRRQVYVLVKNRWRRVGALPGFKTAFAVWASGAASVWASTDQGVYRLKGTDFVRAGNPVADLVGTNPWGVNPGGIRKLPGGLVIAAKLDGVAATIVAADSAGSKDLLVVVDVAGRLALAKVSGNALARIDDLPIASRVVAMTADSAGRVVVAFADGQVAVRRGGAWTTSRVGDDLAAHAAGPGPSRTR